MDFAAHCHPHIKVRGFSQIQLQLPRLEKLVIHLQDIKITILCRRVTISNQLFNQWSCQWHLTEFTDAPELSGSGFVVTSLPHFSICVPDYFVIASWSLTWERNSLQLRTDRIPEIHFRSREHEATYLYATMRAGVSLAFLEFVKFSLSNASNSGISNNTDNPLMEN